MAETWNPGDVVGWVDTDDHDDTPYREWEHLGVVVSAAHRQGEFQLVVVPVMVVSRYPVGTDPARAELVGETWKVLASDLYAVGG